MIHKLTNDHDWVRFPAFYNAYPIRNEVAGSSMEFTGPASSPYGDLYLDDYYGRLFDFSGDQFPAKYGRTAKLNHYVPIPSMEVVDELRVPYRRIPIYKTDRLETVSRVVAELQAQHRGYKILIRGQTKTYMVQRDAQESVHFYGEEKVKEPSFLPSHLRKNFDPYFLKCLWQSQAAVLLNSVAYYVHENSGKAAGNALHENILGLRQTGGFVPFALGIAQHYGLPSVGLDLTDRVEVACWFATHSIVTDSTGKSTTPRVTPDAQTVPTIFVFRCPPDAVFAYKGCKPEGLLEGRPDRQSAWFGHVGWGAASNQLGSYLMCGFRLTVEAMNQLDESWNEKLFPHLDQDPMLSFFLARRADANYTGEARRALQGIYHMGDLNAAGAAPAN
jgi:hypothetical protein